jgi:hypothetical protein
MPAIAYVLDMYHRTNGAYGVNEVILASAMVAIIFPIFSVQPLTFVGVTGLINLVSAQIGGNCPWPPFRLRGVGPWPSADYGRRSVQPEQRPFGRHALLALPLPGPTSPLRPACREFRLRRPVTWGELQAALLCRQQRRPATLAD